MAINVGDNNIVRNVSYKDIRIEQFGRGTKVLKPEDGNMHVGEYAESISFEA